MTTIPFLAATGDAESEAWVRVLQAALPEERLRAGTACSEAERRQATLAVVANPDPAELARFPRLSWVHSVWAGVEKLVSASAGSELKIVRLVDPELAETMAEAVLAWWGIVIAGGIAVPINTAYKGEYLRHQLADSGARVLLVEPSLLDRAERVVGDVAPLEHVVVLGDDAWADRLAGYDPIAPVTRRPSDLATFVYTGGTTGPSKGCMLSHRYHYELSRQIGVCWRRTAEDRYGEPEPDAATGPRAPATPTTGERVSPRIVRATWDKA